MDVIARKVTNALVNRNVIRREDRYYYEDAISDKSELGIKIIVLLVIGMLFNKMILTVLFAALYFGISKATREDQVGSFWGSLLNLVILYLLTIANVNAIVINMEAYYIVLAFASIFIFCTGGDITSSQKYTLDELKEIRAVRRYTLALELFIEVSLISLRASAAGVVLLSCPIIICAVSILTSKLLALVSPLKENRKQVQDNDEQLLGAHNANKVS